MHKRYIPMDGSELVNTAYADLEALKRDFPLHDGYIVVEAYWLYEDDGE